MLVIYSTHQIRCLRAKWNIKSNMKGQNKISKRQALERKESTKEKERLWFLLCVWLALRKTNSFYNHRFFLRRSVLKQIPTINTRVGIFILVGSQHGCLLGPSSYLNANCFPLIHDGHVIQNIPLSSTIFTCPTHIIGSTLCD